MVMATPTTVTVVAEGDDGGSTASAVTWSAIIAGGVAAAAVSFILLILGAGLGFSVVSPWSSDGDTAVALGVGALVWLLDRKFKFGRGRAFALYIMAYTAGRAWIEMLRVDEANTFFGVRLNVFTALLIFLGAAIYFVVVRGPREYVVPIDAPDTAPAAESSDVSQVDVSADDATEPKPPVAYQVVSEERFREYQRTGVLPPAAADSEPVAASVNGDEAAAPRPSDEN